MQQGSPYSITSSAIASNVGGNREAQRLCSLVVDDELEILWVE
jgi:hypothetical protein